MSGLVNAKDPLELRDSLQVIFSSLDKRSDGFVNASTIKKYYEAEYCQTCSMPLVNGVISAICTRKKDVVFKDEFVDVISELKRQKKVSECFFWDFQLLDVEAKGTVPLRKAKLLFKLARETAFSEEEFDVFVNTRTIPKAAVSFEELEPHLVQKHTHNSKFVIASKPSLE